MSGHWARGTLNPRGRLTSAHRDLVAAQNQRENGHAQNDANGYGDHHFRPLAASRRHVTYKTAPPKISVSPAPIVVTIERKTTAAK